MRRFVVVGAGAIGGSLGAMLANSGAEVVLVARGDHAAAIESSGITLRIPDETLISHPAVVRRPEDLRLTRDDVLLMATKTHQLTGALQQWADQPVYPGEDADTERTEPVGTAGEVLPVLLLLNGVEADRVAPRYFRTVYSATVWTPAQFTEPGQVTVRMAPSLGGFLAGPVTAGAGESFLTGIAPAFHAARFEFVPVPDVLSLKYGKLLSNLANGLDALLGPDVDLAEQARALRTEAKAVYRAAGITYVAAGPEKYGIKDRLHITEVSGGGQYGSSTWQSLARGTGSVETDYLNGEIVRLANHAGVTAPKNELIARLCRQVAAGRISPPDRADLVAALERFGG